MWQEKLSKLYKKVRSLSIYSLYTINTRDVVRWYHKKNGTHLSMKNTSTGKSILARDIMTGVVASFYSKVMLKAAEYPGKIDIMYLGSIEVIESSFISGKPRPVPDGYGGFKYVIDDYFTRYVKYECDLIISKRQVKKALRNYLKVQLSKSTRTKIVKKAYKEHPKGKFYRQI